jgi:hypothetical protein
MRVLNGAEKGMLPLLDMCGPPDQEREGHQRDTGGHVCVKLRFRTRLAHGRSARLAEPTPSPQHTWLFKTVVLARSGRPQSGLLVASRSASAILTC